MRERKKEQSSFFILLRITTTVIETWHYSQWGCQGPCGPDVVYNGFQNTIRQLLLNKSSSHTCFELFVIIPIFRNYATVYSISFASDITWETGHDGGNFCPQEIRGNSHKLKTQTLHLFLTLQPESAHAKGLACILWRAGHVSICRLSFPLPCNGFFRQGNGMLRLSVNTDFFFFFPELALDPLWNCPLDQFTTKSWTPNDAGPCFLYIFSSFVSTSILTSILIGYS